MKSLTMKRASLAYLVINIHSLQKIVVEFKRNQISFAFSSDAMLHLVIFNSDV